MTRTLVGILVLVVGALIVWLALSGGLPGRWPDLLLNFGTELLGIVFTVLIIDWLFQRRQKHHGWRRRLLGNLGFIHHQILRKMLPHCDQFRIQDLQDECEGFARNWALGERHFSEGEKAEMTATIEKARAILVQVREYTSRVHQVEDQFVELRLLEKDHNSQQGKTPVSLYSFPWFIALEEEHRRLKDRGTFQLSLLDRATAECPKAMMPQTIEKAVLGLIDLERKSASLHGSIASEIDAYGRLFETAKNDVHQETPPE